MTKKLLIFIFALILAACTSTGSTNLKTFPTLSMNSSLLTAPAGPAPSYKVAAFYYPWYGNPQFDGAWLHWQSHAHVPPHDISSDYYPALGAYSSNDPAVVAQHMAWLRQAGIGVIIVSWWGKGSPEERPVPLILQTAAHYGIKVAFHIEPYHDRTADSLLSDIQYLYQRYGSSPAFFRSTSTTKYSPGNQAKGMFFVWCVKHAPGGCDGPEVGPEYWQKAIDAIHALPQGALVIANATQPSWIQAGHFDGLYNYATLHPGSGGAFAWAHSLPPGALYVPSVIPGFSANRVGYPPDKFVDRNNGQTYSDQWSAALGTGVQPALVTITSFNEWHEGSMIEPIASGQNDGHGYAYRNFGSLPPDGYLTLTQQWVKKLEGASSP